MGWFDAEGIPNGRGGITAVDEPSVAECADGRVMLMARSTVGRLVQSASEDGGQTLDADFAERSGEFVFAAEATADSEYGRLTVCVESGVTG